jgi:hypothetical protein
VTRTGRALVFRSTVLSEKTLFSKKELLARWGRTSWFIKKTCHYFGALHGAWTQRSRVAVIRLANRYALNNGTIHRRDNMGETSNNKAASA